MCSYWVCTGLLGASHALQGMLAWATLSSRRVDVLLYSLLCRAAVPSCMQAQRSSQCVSVAPASEGGPGERVSPGSAGSSRADSPAGHGADTPALLAPDANGQDAAGSAAPAAEAQPVRPSQDAAPVVATPMVLACIDRMPPEHAGCPTFYMIRSADGPVQPLGVAELAAGVDCGLLPHGPTLGSLEQVRACPCMHAPYIRRCEQCRCFLSSCKISEQCLGCLAAYHGGWQAADCLGRC